MNPTAVTTADNTPPLAPALWFGHPRGLTVLFFTEMWEKFSYYGMRSLLVYYMVSSQQIAQTNASLIYGAYTGLCYLTPIPGALIADRWLGQRNAVLIGGIIMAFGHFMMTFDALMFPALATIALGNGLFLPCLAGQIRHLYTQNDPKITTAYNVYYVGVNLGGFLAPLVCGTLGELVGWHWGFAAAGFGMLLGVVIYSFGKRHMPAKPPRAAVADTHQVATQLSTAQRFVLLGAVIGIVVMFRSAYEQGGNTIALWALSGVDRSVMSGWSIPMTWFQALNALLVFLMTPFLLRHWQWARDRGTEAATLSKMAFGAFLVGASYLMIAAVASITAADGDKAHWIWLTLFFVIYTLGELYILPIGLSLFGRVTPGALAATGIAAWFSASFMGNLLAGAVGTFWSTLSPGGFFLVLTGLCTTAGLLLLLLRRLFPLNIDAQQSR